MIGGLNKTRLEDEGGTGNGKMIYDKIKEKCYGPSLLEFTILFDEI